MAAISEDKPMLEDATMKPDTTKFYIEKKIMLSLGVSVNGEVKQVPVKTMKGGVIGAMIVYNKIPKGRKPEDFMEGEI